MWNLQGCMKVSGSKLKALKGNLFVSLTEDAKEISLAVVGPKTRVEQVVVEEQGDSLLIVQSSIDPLFPNPPVIAITPMVSLRQRLL